MRRVLDVLLPFLLFAAPLAAVTGLEYGLAHWRHVSQQVAAEAGLVRDALWPVKVQGSRNG